MAQVQKPGAKCLKSSWPQSPPTRLLGTGLAMECVKTRRRCGRGQQLSQTPRDSSRIRAGYFQFGQHLGRMGRIEEARKMLSYGIVVAQKTETQHARDEMQAALTLLR